eukprot:1158395-Rhodomonas_salina.3
MALRNAPHFPLKQQQRTLVRCWWADPVESAPIPRPLWWRVAGLRHCAFLMLHSEQTRCSSGCQHTPFLALLPLKTRLGENG